MATEKKDKKAKKNVFSAIGNFFKSIPEFFVGEANEIKRIRWPHIGETMESSLKVLFFCILFAIFFILCDAIISKGLLLIGVGQ